MCRYRSLTQYQRKQRKRESSRRRRRKGRMDYQLNKQTGRLGDETQLKKATRDPDVVDLNTPEGTALLDSANSGGQGRSLATLPPSQPKISISTLFFCFFISFFKKKNVICRLSCCDSKRISMTEQIPVRLE